MWDRNWKYAWQRKKTQSDSGITPQSHAGFIWIRDTWNDKSKWGFSLNEIYSYVCSPFSFYCKHNANFVNYKQPWKTLVKLLILNSRIKTLQFFRIKLNEPECKKLVCIALACTVASYGYQTSFFTEDWCEVIKIVLVKSVVLFTYSLTRYFHIYIMRLL